MAMGAVLSWWCTSVQVGPAFLWAVFIRVLVGPLARTEDRFPLHGWGGRVGNQRRSQGQEEVVPGAHEPPRG